MKRLLFDTFVFSALGVLCFIYGKMSEREHTHYSYESPTTISAVYGRMNEIPTDIYYLFPWPSCNGYEPMISFPPNGSNRCVEDVRMKCRDGERLVIGPVGIDLNSADPCGHHCPVGTVYFGFDGEGWRHCLVPMSYWNPDDFSEGIDIIGHSAQYPAWYDHQRTTGL